MSNESEGTTLQEMLQRLQAADGALCRTYTMLTDLESVFRSLKSELGMRPVYHHREDRCEGHLFITVPAYQAVQVIRRKLKEPGLGHRFHFPLPRCRKQV